MSYLRELNAAKSERTAIYHTPYSQFSDELPKNLVLKRIDEKIEDLDKKYKDSIIARSSVSGVIKDLSRISSTDLNAPLITSVITFTDAICKNLRIRSLDKNFLITVPTKIEDIQTEDMSLLIDSVSCEIDFESKLSKSIATFAILSIFLEHCSRRVIAGIEHVKLLNFVIGEVLKLRVEIATDIILRFAGIISDQDVPFYRIFDIDSVRTPDYLERLGDQVLLVETNFSSSRVKGKYSKGLVIDQSKYYEEMYYLHTRFEFDIVYCPIIFFQEMSKFGWKEVIDMFKQGKMDEVTGNSDLLNFFRSLDLLYSTKNASAEGRNLCSLFLSEILPIADLMGSQIYPRGKIMNRCFEFINSPENAYEIADSDYGIKKVVEYNRRHVEDLLLSIKSPRYAILFDYIFSGIRDNYDLLRLRRISFSFAKNLESILSEPEFPVGEKAHQAMRFIKRFIFDKVGISSFGRNSRKEKMHFLVNFEKLSDYYFALIEEVVSDKFSKDWLNSPKEIKIPLFRFIKNRSPAKDPLIKKRETTLEILNNDFSSLKDVDITKLSVDRDSESKLMNLIEGDHFSNLVEIESIDFKKFVTETKLIPNCSVKILNPDSFSHLFSLVFRNIGSSGLNLVENLVEFKRISMSDAIKSCCTNIESDSLDKLSLISDLYEIESVDFENSTAYFNGDGLEKEVFIGEDKIKLIDCKRTTEFVKNFRNVCEGTVNDFRKFKFNVLEKNYLEELPEMDMSTESVVNKMSRLIESKTNLSTNPSELVSFELLKERMPKSNLNKSENYFIDTPDYSEKFNMENQLITHSEFMNPKVMIDNLRAKAKEEDGPVKFRGMEFHENFVSIKSVKISYQTDELMRIMKGSSKIRKNAIFTETLSRVIDKCKKKKLDSSVKKTVKEKIYVPSDDEIEDLGETFRLMAATDDHSDEMKFEIFDENLTGSVNSHSACKLKSFSDTMNSCRAVKALYRLSLVYNSISFECSKWKIREDEVLYADENLKNISYMILPSNRVTNDLTNVRYIIFIHKESVHKDSIYKNDLGQGIHCTNVHEENIEQVKFRADLFLNVFNLCLYQWKKGIFNDQEVTNSFCKIYTLLFSLGTNTKNILSIYKYLNIVNFSDYSNPFNLFLKYFAKDKHNKTVHYLFMRDIINNFNHNLSKVKQISGLTGEQRLRNKSLIIEDLRGIFGSTDNLKDLIEQNTFYNLVEKKTTNSFHSNSKFIETIKSNNDFLLDSSRSGLGIDEIGEDQIDLNSVSCYCRESIFHGIKLVFKDIFSESNIIDSKDKKVLREFYRCRGERFLDKEFFSEVMTDRVYSRFSSTFLSSRKSLKINNSKEALGRTVKQRMIDSTLEYINDIFGSRDRVSPVELFEKTISMVEKNEKFKGTDMQELAHLSALAKKEQHEGDREIYILFIVTKILTVFIQTVFYSLNMLIKGEMVVKPTITKFSLIRDITSEIYQMPSDTEIIFMNGDMASWSGRDIYDKFMFSIDCINELGVMDTEVLNMTKFCFKYSARMKIIIPDNQSAKTETLDPHFKKPCLEYTHSWPQGIYHNPSSFIHACEQRLKTEIMKISIKQKFVHKFLDHSDDKNEIVNLRPEFYQKYVKISNFSPMFFSLKPSQTKDSFSRIISEMVGVQNIKGRIFDNPVKSMRDICTSVKSPFFVQNYKSALSSISGFYDKSCDLVMGDCLNLIAYSYLSKAFGIDVKEYKDLPLDYGGFFFLNADSYNRFGSQIDIVEKFGRLKSKGISINLMYKHLSMSLKFKLDDSMKKMKKSLRKYKDVEKMKFDLDIDKDQFVSNILRSKVNERIEMFRKRDKLTDILNLTNQNSNKVFLYLQDKLIKLSQRKSSAILGAFKFDVNETLDNSLIFDERVLDSFNIIQKRSFKEKEFPSTRDIRDMNHFSMQETRVSLGYSYIDYETVESIVDGKFGYIIKSFSNKEKLTQIANETEKILNHFNVTTKENFTEKKILIRNLLDSYKKKNLVQFRPMVEDVPELTDYYVEIDTERKGSKEFIEAFMSFLPRIVPETRKEHRSLKALDSLKNLINRCLIEGSPISEEEVREIISEYDSSPYEIMKKTKDQYINELICYIFKKKLNNLKDSTVDTKLTLKRSYKLKLLEKSEDLESKMFLIKSLDGSLVDILILNSEAQFYFLTNNDSIDCLQLAKKLLKKSKLNKIEHRDDDSFFIKLEILETEGIVFDPKKNRLFITSTKEDRSKLMVGRSIITRNPVNGDLFSVSPHLYTEASKFKNQLFRTTRILMNSRGGELQSEEDFNEFDIYSIEKIRPVLRLNKKFISIFNGSIRNLTDRKSVGCSINVNHTHTVEESVCCIKNKFFRMRSRGTEEVTREIDRDVIEKSLARASDETGIDVNLSDLEIYSAQTEKIHSKGNWMGSEVVACEKELNKNLMNLTYKIPDQTNDLYDCMNILYHSIRNRMANGKPADTAAKENINFYRSARLIMSRDNRFEKNFNFNEGLSSEESITKCSSENSLMLNRSIVDILNRKIGVFDINSNMSILIKVLKEVFGFEKDKRYHHSSMSLKEFMITDDENSKAERLTQITNETLSKLASAKEELAKITSSKNEYVSRSRVDELVKTELAIFKSEYVKKKLNESVAKSTQLTQLKSEIKLLRNEVRRMQEDSEIKELMSSMISEIEIREQAASQFEEKSNTRSEKEDLGSESKSNEENYVYSLSDLDIETKSFGFSYTKREPIASKKFRNDNFKKLKKRNDKILKIERERQKKMDQEHRLKMEKEELERLEKERTINDKISSLKQKTLSPSNQISIFNRKVRVMPRKELINNIREMNREDLISYLNDTGNPNRIKECLNVTLRTFADFFEFAENARTSSSKFKLMIIESVLKSSDIFNENCEIVGIPKLSFSDEETDGIKAFMTVLMKNLTQLKNLRINNDVRNIKLPSVRVISDGVSKLASGDVETLEKFKSNCLNSISTLKSTVHIVNWYRSAKVAMRRFDLAVFDIIEKLPIKEKEEAYLQLVKTYQHLFYLEGLEEELDKANSFLEIIFHYIKYNFSS
jgi:hypothetical protein